MDALKSFGWTLVNSHGVRATCMIFKTEKAATEYQDAMNILHPGDDYSIIELFVKEV